MATKLNAEQERFVNLKNKNALVSASAGSGKTTTMIEKLKNLILQDFVPVDKLLVVTFTEAAASEMKQKLHKKLQEEISTRNFTEEQLNYFYEQLFQISTADIGTLHAVCKKIVSKYFYVVNVEPAFGILSNEESSNLFNRALDKTFEYYIENADEEFYSIYESFNDKRNSQKLKNIINKIYYYLSEKSNPEQYVDFCISNCLNENINQNICSKYIMEYYVPSLNKFLQEIKGYLNVVSDDKLTNYLKQVEVLVLEVLKATCFTEFSKLINELTFPTLYKPKDEQLFDVFENIKFSVDSFKKLLTAAKLNVLNLTDEQFKNLTSELKIYYNKLFEITFKVESEFTKLKLEQGKLDFSDLQKYTLQILKNNEIKTEIVNNYKYIFVDEYQDINQIQEDILLSLSNGENLNMIGDVKQSIYAFRQCMPEIFLNKYYNYLNNSDSSLILLNKNYRCSKEVVNFVNYCFNTLITKDTVGINYKADSQLVLGSENSGEVNINIINTSVEDDEDDSLQNDEAEALEVLKIISDVYGKPYYNDHKKQTLNLDYKDIAILVRDGKGYVNTLYEVLKNHKIPVNTTLKTTLFNTIEVKPLYSLIKLAANTNSDLDICNVLLSPIINFTYNELAQLKFNNKDLCLWEIINNVIIPDTKHILFDKCYNFIELINEIKYRLNYSTIMEAINHVVIKYDLISYYLSLPNGQEMAENIKQFLSLLNNSGFNFNVNKCLEFLESLSQKDDFLITVESGDNAVKILTMHKSKGLEYPCVILSGLGKSFNKSTYKSDVILTNKLGLGINFKNSQTRIEHVTLQKNANKLFELNEELQGQIRLLYVATTRARNFLYLTGCYNLKNFGVRFNKPISSATNFLDLIFKSFDGNNKFGFLNAKENFELVNNKVKLANVKIVNLFDVKNQTTNVLNNVIISGADDGVVKKLISNFEKIKVNNQEKLATKTSVSAVLKQDDYVNNNEYGLALNFNENATNNLSLLIGNAYHKIMQNLTYDEQLSDVQKLIDRMLLTNEIESEVKPYVDANKIFNAVKNVKKLILPSTKILKEQQFLLKSDYSSLIENCKNDQQVLIQGVIDLVLINNNEAVLIDFKTNKTKDVAKLINAYSLQLQVYKKAIEQGLKVKVNSSKLYLFETQSFIEII